MNDTKLSITDLATTAFAEQMESAERQGDEMFTRHRDEFLTYARGMSRRVLGMEAADQLDWTYTGTMHLPEGVEQATAWIDEGPAYLRYRIVEDQTAFELVQPCGTCGNDQIDTVIGLAALGGLLDVATWKAAEKAVIA